MAGFSSMRCLRFFACLIAATWKPVAPASESDLKASGAPCRLADLFLHSPADVDGNAQPIDTTAAVGQPNTYWALMDYSMKGFDLEARAVPQDRCKLDQMTQSTTMVDPGSNVVVQLTVRDNSSAKDSKLYKVQVSRSLGTETTLKALKVAHGILLPSWNAQIRNYTVYLDVTQDIVKFIFERLDNGQVVGLASSLEEPLGGSGRLLQAVADPLGAPIGEVQYMPSSLSSTIDVGRQRVIDVVVESADRSVSGRYRFKVQRPFCPQERRFFDGMAKKCTDICNEGSFGNPSTGRCTMCLQRHCALCDAQSRCSTCIDGYKLQDGKCVSGVAGGAGPGPAGALNTLTTNVAQYTKRHVVLFVAATAATTACFCSCLFVIIMTSTGRCGNAERRGPRLIDSDDDLSTDRYAYS